MFAKPLCVALDGFTLSPFGDHALPTGDVFRRLRVEISSASTRREVALGRDVNLADERDTRPFVGGRDTAVVTVPLRGLEGPLRWRVVYERVAHPTELHVVDAVVDGAFDIASGELPAER